MPQLAAISTWLLALVAAAAPGAEPAAPPDAGLVVLPTVVVTAPDDGRNASAVSRRDPTAALAVVDVAPRRGEAVDTAQVLSAAPGVVLQDSGGAGQRKTVSLRGLAPNATLVLLDGVPLAGPGQAADLSRIPVAALERLEVLRGGGSARYGPGALGGVVNLVTLEPTGTRVFGAATQGSFMHTQASLGAAFPVLGGDGLLLATGQRSTGAFPYQVDEQPTLAGNALTSRVRENNQALQGGLLLRGRRALGNGYKLGVTAEGLVDERGLAGPVLNPTPTARQSAARLLGSARLEKRFDSGAEVTVLAHGRHEGVTFTGSPFATTASGAPYVQREGSAGAEGFWQQPLGPQHTLSVLAALGGDWLDEPTRRNPGWARAGAMVGDEWLLLDGALALTGSARLDVAGPFVAFSPKLGASLLLPGGFELKANAGQAMRPPSFQELYVVQGTLLPNPLLRPERGLTADATVAWSHAKVSAAVTGFAALYEDLISYEYSPPLLAKPFNFLTASVAGVEAEASVQPADWLSASASYTFLSTKNLRDDARWYLKALPFRPAHRAVARVVAGPKWLKARLDGLYQSAQSTNRTETLFIGERLLLNAGVTVSPLADGRLSLTAELRNLLDVQTMDVDGYPLPPRAAFVTVAFQWDQR